MLKWHVIGRLYERALHKLQRAFDMSRLKFRCRAVGGKARSHYDIGRVAVSGSFPGSFEERQCLRAVAGQSGTVAGIPQCPDALEAPCTGCNGARPRRDCPARSPRHARGPRYALAEDLRDATTLPIDPNALLCWQLCDGIMCCEPEWDVVLDVACKDREVVLPGDRADCQICEPCRVPDASCPIR